MYYVKHKRHRPVYVLVAGRSAATAVVRAVQSSRHLLGVRLDRAYTGGEQPAVDMHHYSPVIESCN